MVTFQQVYDRVLALAAHRHAPAYLGGLSFSEAIIFPIPPDVMLIPMALANRKRAWRFAVIATITSVAGGLVGYLIGLYLYEAIGVWLIQLYSMDGYFDTLRIWYAQYGIWIILAAGFLPIPYKAFTIASGVFAMALIPFLVGSLIGRGARFFAVSAICYWAGNSVDSILRRTSSPVAWAASLVLVIGFVYWTIQ